jgi:tricorn protease
MKQDGERGTDHRPERRFMRTGALVVVLTLAWVWGGGAQARSGYYRSPDLNGDLVVFSAEGDLWTAHLDGSDVRRITTHPGNEVLPKFSPDGKWIAFAGDYDGNRDLFVMPAGGGEPKRLTWHPAADEPVGWTPDGQEILFRSNRENPHYNWELYKIPFTGGDPEKLPLGSAVYLSIDPESGRWAFTPNGGGGTWKRYRGGTASDIWVGDPQRADFKKITDFPGMDAAPMWHGGRIYFLCDQGGTANLWSMNPDGSDRKRLTDFGAWDARAPMIDRQGRIVFMLSGDLHLYNTADGSERTLKIDLPSERLLTRKRYSNPSQYLTEYALSPDGDRLAVVARGEIFSCPAEKGVTLPITHGSGARENRVAFGPKGERAAYVTDESGEEVITTADAWGRGQARTVTRTGTSTFHYQPVWSPEGTWIAYADQAHCLYLVKADGGEPALVDSCAQSEIREYTFSPDGRWLAYAKTNRLERGAIFIYDTRERVTHQITGWYTDDRSPAWDPEGRYLYFLGDRTMNPVIDWVDFETIVAATTRPYLILLRPDLSNPMARNEGAPPGVSGAEKDKGDKGDKGDKDDKGDKGDKGNKGDKGDKSGTDKKDGKGKKDGASSKDEKPEPVEIVFDGIRDRIVELPVDAGRYFGLAATPGKLFYLSVPLLGLAEDAGSDEEPAPRGALMAFDLEDREAKTYLDGVSSFELAAKGGKIAVMKQRGQLYVFDADSPAPDDLSKKSVNLGDLVLELDPQEEWRQIFFEGWRNMRDFYWDPNMHGVDWTAVRDQYASLLPRISTRWELQDLMAEMIGELATSHTYVWGGDPGVDVPQHPTGLLGARLRREGKGFRVEEIYRGDPADRVRSALQEPGSLVKEGEYILAVNHREVPVDQPFEASLENLAGKRVLLTVSPGADGKETREVVVQPMGADEENNLRYVDWVRRNREYVLEKTGGKMGYIHLPDMGGRGLKEFDTWFYPQLDKDGMVVDARWNGGGFVSQLIVSRFMRHLLWWDRGRWGGISNYPYRTLTGPFVVLTNENAGSDGDIFPAAIQTAGLAPVIGTRSWGGVIGIRGNARPLVDSGALTQPEFAWWHPTKGWGLENHGVDPDIEVENLPQDLAHGIDAQLDRGIAEVMRLYTQKPPLKPTFGPAPDRSRKSYQGER